MNMIFREQSKEFESSGSARRALHAFDRNSVTMQMLKNAASKAKFEFESPIYRQGACAHLGLVKEKTVVLVGTSGESFGSARVVERRKKWEHQGWRFVFVRPRDILETSVDKIADDLKELTGCKVSKSISPSRKRATT